jgi:hypothetical protein
MFLAACGSSSSTATPEPPPSGGFSNSNLNGTYVFSASGTDVNDSPYAAVGTFTANGSGGITAGTIDINDPDSTSPVLVSGSPITSASYSVNVDGRGQATLDTGTAFQKIVLDFVLQDSSHGLVIEFDGVATGSGTIDLQSSGVTPSGTYAFLFTGADLSGAFATAGNFTVGSDNAVTGVQDFNSGGIAYANLALTGTVVPGPATTPGSSLTVSSGGFGTLTFDVYPIDANHLKFIEIDTTGTLSGEAYSQTSATVPTGTLAFTMNGAISGDDYFAAGGFLVTDGTGDITNASSEDINADGSPSTAPVSFTGSYAAEGTGRYLLNNFSGFIGGTQYVAYPYSGGLFLLEADDAGTTVGAAYTQSSTATLAASQGYGMNLSGANLAQSSVVEVDDIAEFSTGTSGTLTGIIDENYTGASKPLYASALTDGSYGSISTGRSGVAASANTLAGGFSLILYTIDGTTFPFIESDSAGQVSTGVIVQQNASAASSGISKSHLFVAPRIIQSHPSAQPKSLKRQ